MARKINPLGADVVVCPMQTMGSWGRKYGLVLTLHDLIYYEHPAPPGFLPAPVRVLWRLYHKAFWPQRLLLNRADIVATISSTTEALMAKYRLTSRPVRIISNAPQPDAGTARRRRRGGAFARLHGLVHALQKRGDHGGRHGRAAGLHPAPAEQDHPATPGRAGDHGSRLAPRWCSTTA